MFSSFTGSPLFAHRSGPLLFFYFALLGSPACIRRPLANICQVCKMCQRSTSWLKSTLLHTRWARSQSLSNQDKACHGSSCAANRLWCELLPTRLLMVLAVPRTCFDVSYCWQGLLWFQLCREHALMWAIVEKACHGSSCASNMLWCELWYCRQA